MFKLGDMAGLNEPNPIVGFCRLMPLNSLIQFTGLPQETEERFPFKSKNKIYLVWRASAPFQNIKNCHNNYQNKVAKESLVTTG